VAESSRAPRVPVSFVGSDPLLQAGRIKSEAAA
jgi:hypothetical protein